MHPTMQTLLASRLLANALNGPCSSAKVVDEHEVGVGLPLCV